MRAIMHPDGSATIKFDNQEDLDRCSSCSRCMERIGNESYCVVRWPMAKVVVHKRCVVEDDVVVGTEPSSEWARPQPGDFA